MAYKRQQGEDGLRVQAQGTALLPLSRVTLGKACIPLSYKTLWSSLVENFRRWKKKQKQNKKNTLIHACSIYHDAQVTFKQDKCLLCKDTDIDEIFLLCFGNS